MKIKRTRLAEIIREEILGLLEFSDGSDEPKKEKKRPSRAADVTSAELDPTAPNDQTPDGGTVKGPDASPVPPSDAPGKRMDPSQLDEPQDGPEGGPEEPEADPDAESDEEDAVDAAGDAGEDPSGAVNDDVSGKTVQAITIDPKSKVLPGAKEVVVAFNESTDTLRILVTPTGMVKFFWKNSLHDLP